MFFLRCWWKRFGIVGELLRFDSKLLWRCWVSALVLWANCFQHPGELCFRFPSHVLQITRCCACTISANLPEVTPWSVYFCSAIHIIIPISNQIVYNFTPSLHLVPICQLRLVFAICVHRRVVEGSGVSNAAWACSAC